MTRPSGLSLVSFMLFFSLVASATIGASRPAVASAPGSPDACAPVNDFSLQLPAAAAQIDGNSVTLSWQAAANATDYTYQLSRNPGFAPPHWYKLGDVTSVAHGELLQNGVWYWRVRAWNRGPDCAEYRDSEVRSFVVSVTPPGTPVPSRPPAAYQQRRTQLDLSWSPVAGAIMYAVYIDDDPGFGSPLPTEYPMQPRATVGPLTQGIYYWRVRAFDSAGNGSAFSAARDITIGSCNTPDPGTWLTTPTAGHVTPSPPDYSTEFRWISPAWSSDIWVELYEIALNGNVDWNSPVSPSPIWALVDATSHKMALAEGNYAARMRGMYLNNGCDILGEYGPATSFFVDLPGGPPVLSFPPPASRVNTGPRPVIRFGAVAGALAYQVQFLDTATSAVVAKRVGSATEAGCAAGPGTVCGLAPPANLDPGSYSVSVSFSTTAHPSYTWGGWSQPAWIDVLSCDQAAPVLLSPGAFTNDVTPTFAWQAVPNAGDYSLQVKFAVTDTLLIDVPLVGSTSYTPTVALQDVGYKWRVRGTPLEGCTSGGTFSPYNDLTIDTVAPAAPWPLTPVPGEWVTYGWPYLAWTRVADAALHEVNVRGGPPGQKARIYRVGGAGYSSWNASWPAGEYIWSVRAIDRAGNISRESSLATFEITPLRFVPAILR